MKAILLISLIIGMAFVGVSNEMPRTIAKHEMLQAVKEGSIQPLVRDSNIQNNEKLKILMMKETLKEQKIFLIDSEDFPTCQLENLLIDYYYSKDLSNAVNIVRSFKCEKEEYSVLMDCKIYKNSEYARLGAKLILSNSPNAFFEDQINRSFNGKKYGDFCVNTGEAKMLPGMTILFKNYFIKFYVSHERDHAPAPGLLDLWAEKIVSKIKDGYAEKHEPTKQ